MTAGEVNEDIAYPMETGSPHKGPSRAGNTSILLILVGVSLLSTYIPFAKRGLAWLNQFSVICPQ